MAVTKGDTAVRSFFFWITCRKTTEIARSARVRTLRTVCTRKNGFLDLISGLHILRAKRVDQNVAFATLTWLHVDPDVASA
eukprot:3607762-Rhodomonas_salina.3